MEYNFNGKRKILMINVQNNCKLEPHLRMVKLNCNDNFDETVSANIACVFVLMYTAIVLLFLLCNFVMP